ncbi:MAG: MurR/RpiR family transcriptional regulator [Eubacteriales bacterium]|jgi:DNA-binding MurR/RpiR family transcriptional regulator|nr:MurR/RpiR family transcriptional regulator [Eubacteriales bacterium]MDD4105126.1 MurR/RpiR family transcriptional regulator [Eubacteriales bacterium]MDD4710941.1 MurR/RpiR family transcriptional regulator [Eubacteriales bacterium]
METMSIIEKLKKGDGRLSKSHRKIAAFISDQYDKAVFMTAARLGEVLDISESTVVRFATSLGYEGYPQMQKALKEIVRHRLTSAQRFEISVDMAPEDTVKAVLNTDMRNIRTTLQQLNEQVFMQVVETISSSRSIYVLGLRSAAPLSAFFGYYLHYIFDDVRVVNAINNDVFEIISRIGPEDTLIAISFPRYSSRTLESMRFANSRGAKVVALTDGPLSPLHDYSDLCLDAQTEMASFADSMAAPMSLVNALLAALGVQNQDRLNDSFEQLEEIWDKYRVYANRE